MKHSLPFGLLGAFALAAVKPSLIFKTPPQGDERFGVMTHFAHGWDLAWAPVAARTTVSQVRDELYWANIERTPGVFSFPPEYDRNMATLNQHRLSPLIVLSFENPNYDNGNTPHSDEAIAAYARYAVEVLRRYGSQIKAVEIWNEYNGTFNRGPATEDRAGTYLRMLRAAYTAIKRERPDVIVVGGSTSGTPLPYWRKLLAGGGLDYMDALSVHPYRYDTTPEGIENEIAGLHFLVREFSGEKTKPIWVTEIGWFTRPSAGPGDLAIDDATEAKFLTRAYALLLSVDVQRIYWYLLRDYQDLDMGLFREDEARSPKPAALAFTTLVQQLRGAKFVRRELTHDKFYSLLFATPAGDELRVMWSLSPTSISTEGVTAGVDLEGRPIRSADRLTIDDAPVFLRGAVADLPPASAPAIVLADSGRDFSATQGKSGWSYGALPAASATLSTLVNFTESNWAASWTGAFPFLSVTAGDQHPSVLDGTPVAAVRRWVSDTNGAVRIAGYFRSGTSGDGVGVSITVDGHRRFRKLLGGGQGNAVVEEFDFTENVRPGTPIDFAVDPGPAANIDFDATTVTATITRGTP